MNEEKSSVGVTRFAAALMLLLCASTAFWLYAPQRLPLAGASLGVAHQWILTPDGGIWSLPAWFLPIGVLVILGGTAALAAYDRFHRAKTRSEQRNSLATCVGVLALLATLWPWALLGPGGTQNLINTTWSDTANQYFAAAYEVNDVRQFTREYASRQQTPPSRVQAHTATHPPGAVLFYYFARRTLEAIPPLQSIFSSIAENLTALKVDELATTGNTARNSAARAASAPITFALPAAAVGGALWSAFLLSLCVGITVPAIYLLARSTSCDDEGIAAANETRGLVAAALFALAPCSNSFTFSLDAFIACLATWSLACLAKRLRGGSRGWTVACGSILALTSFVSFGALSVWAIIVLMAGLYHLFGSTQSASNSGNLKASVARAVTDIAFCALGFIALWLVLLLLFPMQLPLIFKQAMAVHHAATIAVRSYGIWWWLNLLIFSVFCGWPVIVSLVMAIIARVRRAESTDNFETARSDVAFVVGFATIVTLLLLTLSGNVRGEVERLWMFALPPLCVLAAQYLRRPLEQTRFVVLMLCLQAIQTCIMAAALAPLVRPF